MEIKNRGLKLDYIKWEELKTFERNNLKVDFRDVSKLKKAIIKNNFSFPFYVWDNYILDGDGRLLALEELEAENYIIPDLPAIVIQATNKEEAKKLVLQVSSKHGEITKNSFDSFLSDLEDIDWDVLSFDFDVSGIENVKETLDDVDYQDIEEDIDFDDIKSNENREVKITTQKVTCPSCEHVFDIGI